MNIKTPYWQITIETPRYGCSEGTLEHDKDKAMSMFFETAKTLNAGQTAYLYSVDDNGFVRPEYTVIRK